MERFYYTSDINGANPDEFAKNADLGAVMAYDETDAKRRIASELNIDEEELYALEHPEYWVACHSRTDLDRLANSEPIDITVREPGTHPGGGCWWVSVNGGVFGVKGEED